jgi:GrpB-like predicted nucleotidyltransferase (UPF0157 family)
VSGSFNLVEIVEHDPSWAARFDAERTKLASIFDGRAVAIEHIGSTSVPGLCAKPIVDILVGLRELELSEAEIEAMDGLGYEYLGEFGLPGRLYFRKGEPRTHHVHVVAHGGDHWDRHLAFRDTLRSNPEERRRYDELKRQLAAEGHSREAYSELKTPFIREVEARAVQARDVGPTA